MTQNPKLDEADEQLVVHGGLEGGDGPIQDDGDRHLGDAVGELG